MDVNPHAAPGSLSAEQIQALRDARVRARKVRRAVGVATLSGWTMALFAAMTMLGVAFGSISSLVVGAALGGVAFNELRGAAMLRRLDERGTRVLGWNQVGLGVLIVVYAGWSLARSLGMSGLESMGGTTGDAKMDEMVAGISRMVSMGLYGTMAVVGSIVPALTSWYYFTRRRGVRALLAETPSWAVEALRAAA